MNPYGDASSRAVIHTGHSSSSYRASSDQDVVPSPGPDRSTLPLPAADSGSTPPSGPAPVPSPSPRPAPDAPPCCQVSVIVPSPEPRPPLGAQCSRDSCPDLECSICFSQFNNVFRCPKMLRCNHTFCLECLARINVKSPEPGAIQCPLCRGFTPLPSLGLPKLATDPDVLSYLPAAMQRVYSVRFLRSKGRLQVKRSVSSGSAPGPTPGRALCGWGRTGTMLKALVSSRVLIPDPVPFLIQGP